MRHRELNERGTFTIKSFAFDQAEAKPIFWICPECHAKLFRGLCRPWQESIDEGSVIPCPYCESVWALNDAFYLRKASPSETFDTEIFASEIIGEWAGTPPEIMPGEEDIPF
jgi:DNA-directed RNA polymerase subunit RPC12/RpoP